MKVKMCWWAAACLVCLCGLLAAPAVVADDITDAKVVCSKCSSAVVKVLVIVKVTDGGESYEHKLETAGTIIDPSGLTVVSLSTVDPSGMYSEDETEGLTLQVTGVKLRVADGKEIPAELVLRDKDLDLGFIRPVQKPSAPFASVNLKDAAKVDLLDEIVVLTRLGQIADRIPSVCIEHVQAVVERPRRFYVVSLTSMGDEYGSPVFTPDGKVVGVVARRRNPGRQDDFDYEASVLPVVISAEDVATVAAQALNQSVGSTEKSETKQAK